MSRQSRKLDHIKYALLLRDGPVDPGFKDIHLLHNALPELDFAEVDLSTTFMGFDLAHPVVINAITGGCDEVTAINRDLAKLAAKTNSVMAVGSQFAAVGQHGSCRSYEVIRKENPNGIVLANLGAHATVRQAQTAVDMIQADALQIHLNPAQEMMMPEGDRSFVGYLEQIAAIASALDVPVMVKEVGTGIAREQAKLLCRAKIRALDIAGAGGTNFMAIEAQRAQPGLDEDWQEWGIPTAASALEIFPDLPETVELMISGGVRSPLDVVKSMAIGARTVGMAAPWLKQISQYGVDQAAAHFFDFLESVKKFMLLTGAGNSRELLACPRVITGFTGEWLAARQTLLKP